ncbi:MAG: Gfo/Idh/MocA family oxidoreductase [Phenylobacterium sp.]|nr:MAG: Gfo/Idh/MocA family oxidoreductase [Phenylobacterium sp.]
MSSETTDATPIGVGIVGLGKIAHDQHIPAIQANPAFKLVAYASPTSAHTSLEGFKDMGAMLAAHPDIQAVSLCTPPTVRFALARQALEAGRAVLLEKPPGATLGEVDALRDLAAARKQTIFAAWHAREAPAVDPAKAWLAGRQLKSARIIWKEDVRHWHPGQEWVWSPGALGVFDPGINALSILTKLLDERVIVRGAELFVPANRQTPIAANLDLATETGVPIRAEFDWRQTGAQTWNVELETDRGRAVLSLGGAKLEVDGKVLAEAPDAEYPGLYRVFAGLVRAGRSELDAEPLRVVADAFLLGARTAVEAFSF